MRYLTSYKHPKGLRFILDKDPHEYCVYMYSVPELYDEDLKNPYCQSHQDEDAQDTLESAQRRAFEMYGVPVDSWTQVKE